jgi:long-chain acyl-CoA synthetase
MSRTIYSEFQGSAGRNRDAPALMHRAAAGYEAITYAGLAERVSVLRRGLAALGIGKGDTAAVLSPNRPEWVFADLALLSLGAIVVPLHGGLSVPQVRYILADSHTTTAFVSDRETLELLLTADSDSGWLRHVVVFDDVPDGRAGRTAVTSLRAVMASAEGRGGGGCGQGKPLRGDDVGTIVYTSGTTGEPKGVQLTHENVVSDALAVLRRCPVDPSDVLLSYLPLSHMFERTCGCYAALFGGACIAYAREVGTVAEDALAVRPTAILAVPRVLERACSAVTERVAGGSSLRRWLMSRAVRSANRYANLRYRGDHVPVTLWVARPVYDRLVLSKLRSITGGRLRLIVCGGAPLDRQTAKLLLVVGLQLTEGYGLTEAGPVVACGVPGRHRLGTAGPPLEGVQVRVGANGEVLVRGPNVMAGYLNRPEETREAIDADGWLHTGDQGEFDEAGNLTITGRIKELIVTAYGKNVSPAGVESAILRSRYIDQAIVCGDRRKFLSALIVANRALVTDFCRTQGLEADDYAQVLAAEAVRQLIQSELEAASAGLAHYETVKAFALLADPFTVANGLLTPTLKPRRKAIEERYASELEGTYAS